MSPPPDPDAIARELGLEPLPQEGGLFRRTHADAHSSAIYFLLVAPDFSALHSLTATETYHFHAGSPLRMLLLDEQVSEPVLGTDIAAGQRPQLVVPAGTWQGSSSTGAWTLLGTTTAPPFVWSAFTLGERAALTARYPEAAGRIGELTR